MRIAVNTRLLIDGKMDGIGWFTYETISRLVQIHPEHQFYFFFDRKPHPKFVFAKNVYPIKLWPPARHPLLWWIFFEISTRYALRHHKIDLYISTDGFIPLHTKIPTLDVIHDLNFEHSQDNLKHSHQWFYNHFFPRYAHKATRIATVSQFSKQDIHKTYQIPMNKIGVVYNGANAIYQPLPEKEQQQTRNSYADGRKYFIFISTIIKRKNLSGLLKAFDQFKKRDCENTMLLVVGKRQWWYDELESTYKQMSHAMDVKFLGHTAPEQLARLLSASIALVYPSFFEGFGIPIIEAFYAETAVITSNVTSMPEVAGNAAILINPHEPNEIADAMHRIATDQDLRQRLIAQGRQQRELFSWEKSAHRLWSEVNQTWGEEIV
ncbi:MAG: glycosyltransferase family 4 protein [Bacteroidales bacterium]|nr:glycosyltransferase family 4 protein [Bacteroidales bacterium]